MNRIGDHSGRKLRLDKANGRISGVCAGLANYFNTDPLLIRLLFAVGTLAGLGSFVLIYIALALMVGRGD